MRVEDFMRFLSKGNSHFFDSISSEPTLVLISHYKKEKASIHVQGESKA